MTTSTRRSSTRSAAALLALVVIAAAPTPARGEEETVASYRDAVARGAERFQDGDYRAARQQFELAYDIHPAPILLFNIASTHRREGDRTRALRYYRRFLAAAEPSDSRRALALKTVAELEEQEPAPPPPARSALPPAPPAPGPIPAAAALEREHAPSPRRSSTGRVLRWTGIAAGAVALTSLALAWSAARDARAAERYLEELPADQAWDQAQEAAYRDGRAARDRAVVYGVAGGALATAGAVLFVVGGRF